MSVPAASVARFCVCFSSPVPANASSEVKGSVVAVIQASVHSVMVFVGFLLVFIHSIVPIDHIVDAAHRVSVGFVFRVV